MILLNRLSFHHTNNMQKAKSQILMKLGLFDQILHYISCLGHPNWIGRATLISPESQLLKALLNIFLIFTIRIWVPLEIFYQTWALSTNKAKKLSDFDQIWCGNRLKFGNWNICMHTIKGLVYQLYITPPMLPRSTLRCQYLVENVRR